MIAMNSTDGPEAGDGKHRGDEPEGPYEEQRRHAARVVGLALIAVGLWALFRGVARVPFFGPLFLPIFSLDSHAWDLLFLPALGCVLLVWGTVVRKIGLLIPGGVLAGIGLGVMATQGPLGLRGPDAQGGVILASMGLGWAAVAVLAVVFVDRRAWWPLIPAAVLGTLGLALLTGGSAGLAAFSAVAVPAGLIAAGVLMMWRLRGGRTGR